MVVIYEVVEDVSIIVHNGRDHSHCDLCDRSIVVIEESIFERHDVVANETIFADNKESGLGCHPDIPVE